MKRVKTMTCATLTFLVVAGCGAGEDDAGSMEALGSGEPGAAAPAAGSAALEAEADVSSVPAQSEVAASVELARIEFADGNVVRFEELGAGVLVSEMGSDLNPRHLVPKEGLTALAAFKSLAPGRAIPAALSRLHERLHPAETALSVEQSTRPAADAPRVGEEPRYDPDLEHNGEFQQSYPAADFLAVMCDFSTGSGSYKHTNRTDPHTDISLDVHAAYFAVGADIGTITAQPCSGKNAGGFFDGECGQTVSVNAGFHNSGFYDAGDDLVCTEGGGLGCRIFGCPEICVRNQVRFELVYARISNSVNFHECVQITH